MAQQSSLESDAALVVEKLRNHPEHTDPPLDPTGLSTGTSLVAPSGSAYSAPAGDDVHRLWTGTHPPVSE